MRQAASAVLQEVFVAFVRRLWYNIKATMLCLPGNDSERIGDREVNVAEWTKYNETGVHRKFSWMRSFISLKTTKA